MSKKLLILALVLALLPVCALGESDLDAALSKTFRGHKAAGGAVVVAREGEIVYTFYYGWADKKAKEPVTEDTYFRTASVTKMVSAIRIMQLVEQGSLALDESIGTALGYGVTNPYAPNTPVTLRMLMSHTSSLRPYGGYTNAKRTLQQLLDDSTRQWNNFYDYAPGSRYDYSNFGAGVLGSLMEAATGKNLNDTVTEGVFAPLGIDAAYHPTLVEHPERIASVYDIEGKASTTRSAALAQTWDASVSPDTHYRITIGSLWIKPVDLCRLGMLLCDGGTLDGVTLLQKETVAEMLDNQKGKGDVTCDSPYGLCVNRVESLVEGRTLYGHQGLTDEILCNVYFDPETRFVFTLVTNGSSTNMDNRIGKLARKAFALCWEAFQAP